VSGAFLGANGICEKLGMARFLGAFCLSTLEILG
jgi:hypothetical protein